MHLNSWNVYIFDVSGALWSHFPLPLSYFASYFKNYSKFSEKKSIPKFSISPKISIGSGYINIEHNLTPGHVFLLKIAQKNVHKNTLKKIWTKMDQKMLKDPLKMSYKSGLVREPFIYVLAEFVR